MEPREHRGRRQHVEEASSVEMRPHMQQARRRVGGPGACEDNALAIPGLSRGNGANALIASLETMNAKTDRGAVKPLASQDASVSPIAPALDKRIREALATPGRNQALAGIGPPQLAASAAQIRGAGRARRWKAALVRRMAGGAGFQVPADHQSQDRPCALEIPPPLLARADEVIE
jgi:hypothetical protein